MANYNKETFEESVLSILERNHASVKEVKIEVPEEKKPAKAKPQRVKKTHSEKYELLTPHLKLLYDCVINHAVGLAMIRRFLSVSAETIKVGNELLVRLEVRTRDAVIAKIGFVDEQIRISALYNSTIRNLKSKPLEFKIKTEKDAKTVITMVDLAYARIMEVKDSVAEERKLIRKQKELKRYKFKYND